jgi:dolichol-phosphate mannosyltransferase
VRKFYHKPELGATKEMHDEPMVTVILPTYREVENLPLIIPRIHEALKQAGISHEVLVMDDDSPDGTYDKALELSREYPVRAVRRTSNRGLSAAVLDGFREARGQVAVVMDADLSHPPEALPQLVSPVLQGRADIVVGSRHVPGGAAVDWPWFRRFVSWGASLLARPLTRMTDPTSGFMAVRLDLLDGAPLDPVGWKIVLETVVKTGGRLEEIPIQFRDRELGESKLTAKQQLEYLRHLVRLYRFRFPFWTQLALFVIVGGFGVFVDMGVLFAGVEWVGLDPRVAVSFAFLSAATFNYALNWRFTFRRPTQRHRRSYPIFVIVCLVGLALRQLVFLLLLPLSSHRYWYLAVNLVGIALGGIANFVLTRTIVFPQRKEKAGRKRPA